MYSSRVLFLAACLVALPAAAAAQSASPTLPSDTLEANFAPRSAPGPKPDLAPTLPSDTLRTQATPAPPGVQREPPDELWRGHEQWHEEPGTEEETPERIQVWSV
jgi:hypothetical protein